MANTQVTGDLIASGTITADNLVSGTLDSILGTYLSTNSYATESYVTTAVSNLIDAAPASLDTLNELAAALNDDANFATTVTDSIATKLPLAGGTLTGDLIVNARIGVNSSSPLALIHVTQDEVSNAVRLTGRSSDGLARIDFYAGDDTTFLGRLQTVEGNNNIRLRSTNDLEFTVAGSERMRITSAGNVGIGTSSVTAPLTLSTPGSTLDGSFFSTFTIRNTGTSTFSRIRFDTGSTPKWGLTHHSDDTFRISNLDLNGTGAADDNAFTILKNNNVGIGTSSPSGVGTTLNLRGIGDANSGLKISSVIAESYDGATFVSLYSGIGGADVPSIIFPSTGLRFGQGDKGTASYSEKMRIASNGNVGIGTSSPATKLDVQGQNVVFTSGENLEATAVFKGNGSTASRQTYSRVAIIPATTYGTSELYFTTRGTSSYNGYGCGVRNYYGGSDARRNNLSLFTSGVGELNVDRLIIYHNGNYDFTGSDISDISFKENITEITSGLSVINALIPKTYNMIGRESIRKGGFIAQEVEQVLPEAVHGEDGQKGLDYKSILAHATKAIQELKDIVDQQQIEINNLKAQLK